MKEPHQEIHPRGQMKRRRVSSGFRAEGEEERPCQIGRGAAGGNEGVMSVGQKPVKAHEETKTAPLHPPQSGPVEAHQQKMPQLVEHRRGQHIGEHPARVQKIRRRPEKQCAQPAKKLCHPRFPLVGCK